MLACWAHFRRHLLSAQDLAKTAAAKRVCREALAWPRRRFRLWHRDRGDPLARGGPITRDPWIANARPVEKAFLALAARAVNLTDTDASHLARALCDHHPHVLTFGHEAGVEPTNNLAERALRHAVPWRKTSVGNRREDGERAVARLLTITRTCQLQQRNVLAYLTAAIRSHRHRQAAASLLPQRSTP